MQRANWNQAPKTRGSGAGGRAGGGARRRERPAREKEEEVERGVNSLGRSWLVRESIEGLEHQRAAKYSWLARSFGGQAKPPMNSS